MQKEKVIILHGIFKTCRHMRKVTKFFNNHNYDAECINYPSTKYSILELVDIIHEKISATLGDTKYKKIHFIGYSMGGLLTRLLLSKYKSKYKNLGRVVLLAPPNDGSEVASFLKNFWPYQILYGPAGQELELGIPLIKPHLKKLNIEIGVLAGDSSNDPISSIWLIKGEDDGKVSVASTRFDGMADHMVLPVTHTAFPYSKKVHLQAYSFLRDGKFVK